MDHQNVLTNSSTNLLSKAFPRKCRNLSRIVKHYGHDRRVIVTKNLKTHLLELWPEEITILTDTCKFLGTCNTSQAERDYSMEDSNKTHGANGRGQNSVKKSLFGTSIRAILPKDNFNSRDNLLHCWWWHGSSIQMGWATMLQVLNYLLKVITGRISKSPGQSN